MKYSMQKQGERMDKLTKEDLSKIFKQCGFSSAEQKIANYSDTASTQQMNHSRVISTLLLTKQLKQSTDRTIESNKLLAEAEDRNSKKMQWLTWVLVGVGALQTISIFSNC